MEFIRSLWNRLFTRHKVAEESELPPTEKLKKKKKCSQCKKEKNLRYFDRYNGLNDIHSAKCKKCRKIKYEYDKFNKTQTKNFIHCKCHYCGKDFGRYISAIKRNSGKYCSRRCHGDAMKILRVGIKKREQMDIS